MKPILLWGFMLLPFLGFSQVVDSVSVAREVDSLVQVCRGLTGQKNYEEALSTIELAKSIAGDAFGQESARYASCVFNKGRVFYFMQKYAEAEYWYLEAKNIREKILGREHIDYIKSLNNLALLYDDMDNYTKAESFYIEVKTIHEKMLGNEDPEYATSLYNLANLYMEMGNYLKSELLFVEAKKIREKVLGKNHPDYVACIYYLAKLYEKMGNYKEAESLLLEAKDISNNDIKKGQAENYVASLHGLASLYETLGNYEEAEQMLLEVKKNCEKIYGKKHPNYASTLNSLAILYERMCNYEKAELLFIETNIIFEDLLGKENANYARSINNLAILYMDIGKYDKAEPLFYEVKGIFAKALGKEHADYARCLSNLAILYTNLGNYDKAEQLLLESINIREKVLGKEHLEYANNLNSLAILHMDLSNYDKAETLLLEANTIYSNALGKEHPQYASSLDNLASLYKTLGNYEKAEKLFLEAKSIREKVLGQEHLDYATSLNNQATLFQSLRNYKNAELLFLEAKSIREKILGKEHPDYLQVLENLIFLYENQNRVTASTPLLIELLAAKRNRLSQSINYLSELELAHYSVKFQDGRDNPYAYLFDCSKNISRDTILLTLAYDNALFQKGFLLQGAARINELTSASPESQELNLRLKSYRRRLAAEYSKPIAERKGIAELEEKANSAEKELARSVAGYADAIRQVSWQDVQSSLKKGETAIEFVHFKVNFPQPTDSTMYAALLLRPGDAAPQFIPLFEERQLTALLKGASGKAYDRINALYDPESQPGDQKNLYDLIWKPIEAHLAGVETVYCASSGLLHKINLGAIRLGSGKETFSDQYQLITLNSTRRLVLPDNTARTDHTAQLFGGIRYTTDSTAIAAANVKLEGTRGLADEALPFHTDSTLRGDAWNYLPETAAEVRDIQHVFQSKNWSAQLDTGYLATEEAFRNMGNGKPSPRILHIATHGFFYPDPKTSTNDKYRMMEGHEPVFKLSDHPMIRSGLLLAGAQEAWSTGKATENREDGILTAYEISQMNLSNTELVVLSACETGLGDIEGNEGVYGLQRAFKIAGAKYLIMSLWKVSDRSSRELMTEFYRYWLSEGLSIPDAFRKAQGLMKQKYPDAPYHWAGFVLVE